MRNGKFVVGIDFDGTLAKTVDYKLERLFPMKNQNVLMLENALFLITDLLGLGQHSSKKILNDIGDEGIDKGLKDLIQRLTASGKIEFVVVTANTEIELIRSFLKRNGLDIEVLHSKRGGKNGFKFIDLVVDDGFREIKKNVFWEAEHNLVFGSIFRGIGLKVASNSEQLESIINNEAKALLLQVKRAGSSDPSKVSMPAKVKA